MSEELSLQEIRLQKLARMRELGHDPFAVEEFSRTGSAKQLLGRSDYDLPQEERPTVSYAGRVVSYRDMGKAGFAHLSDGDAKIQVYCRKDELGEVGWELYQLLDLGDHVGVKGFLFLTKTGERSIHVQELVPLSKSLQTLPLGKEKDGQQWYGLTDVEQRYRHRHLDLITNPDARKMLIDRARVVSAVRRYFDGEGYLEVETPLLQLVAGGAAARPFTTHYNAYEMDVKLRISLELYLKRLICGDIPAVYEIGRVFRNEGVSNRHNPEFTLLEFYEAYTNLEGMMRRVEEMFAFVAKEVYGTTTFTRRVPNWDLLPGTVGTGESPQDAHRRRALENGFDVTFDVAEWLRMDLISQLAYKLSITPELLLASLEDLNLFKDHVRQGLERLPLRSTPGEIMVHHKDVPLIREPAFEGTYRIWSIAGPSGIDLDREDNVGGLLEKLLEALVEPYMLSPTFVVGYPIETSPLAKKDPSNPRMTRRFEGYVLGREVCNAFSEINDPIDQRERFEQQATEMAKGDEEAHPYDEEFLYALEGGMPPTGGCGIGMERLAMILTGAEHIREVMFFPMMKPGGAKQDA